MSLGSRLISFGWIAVGVIGLAVVAIMSLAMRSQSEAERWVTHTFYVEGQLRLLDGDVNAMSAKMRGYIVARQQAWLDDYRSEVDTVRREIAHVQDLTADNPIQRRNVAELKAEVEDLAKWCEHVVDLSQRSGQLAAMAAITTGEGGSALTRVTATTERMFSEEEGLLSRRETRSSQIRRAAFALSLALGILMAIQLTASAFLVRSRHRAFEREQELLRQARLYAESIVATVREPLLVLDSYLHVVSANRSFHLVFGTTPEGTTGVPLAELNGGHWNIPELLERLHHVFAGGGELANFALEHESAGLGRRHLLLSARKVFRPGNHTGLVLVAIEDDTERSRAEQKLKLSNAELESFAYSVAHDLRSPLRGMQGFSEALIEDYSAVLGETGRNYAQHIGNSARRMDELIRDLLDYSRIARTEVQLEAVPLAEALAAARQQVAPALEAAGASVAVQEPLPTVRGHFSILVQVLANLLTNAAKFVPAGTPPRMVIRVERRGQRQRLWIEDNGIGIAPQFHERIFRVFERLHGQESYPGTGIGLAIVRKGAERMNAQVGVESDAGQGARFWIDFLPC